MLTQILNFYGAKPAGYLACQTGYRNHSYPAHLTDGRMVNLILYKSDADILSRIRSANAVSSYLAASSLPVRHPADTHIVVLRIPTRIKYAALYNYLPGFTIPWEAYTRHHLMLLGATMSQMHAALVAMPRNNLPLAAAELQAILTRMRSYFAQAAVQSAAHSKLGIELPLRRLDRLRRVLEITEQLPHRQPLHMDFVRGNILFQDTPAGPEVSGILDFEKTAFGHPVFDVARTLAFLLVDSKYKTEHHVRKYFLQSGYNKRGAAKFQQPVLHTGTRSLNLLEELVDLFLMYDLYKFLRHNPYESLPENEHFVRTKDLLLARSFILRSPRQIKRGLQRV